MFRVLLTRVSTERGSGCGTELVSESGVGWRERSQWDAQELGIPQRPEDEDLGLQGLGDSKRMMMMKSRRRVVRWWEGKRNGRVSRRMWESWRKEESCSSNKEKVEERWSTEGKGRDVLKAVPWGERGAA